MHRDVKFFTGNAPTSHSKEVGGYEHKFPFSGHYVHGVPYTPLPGTTIVGTEYGVPSPLNRFEFQPSKTCPKNFIIFDQTNDTNKVMFHPALAHKFGAPNFKICASNTEEVCKSMGRNTDNQCKGDSSLKEDTEDINVLLNSEEEEDYEDDEVVSTGRTPGDNLRGSAPDFSYPIECPKSHKSNISGTHKPITSTHKSISSSVSCAKRKRDRIKKMVQALRGIIPGGEQLDSSGVIDEAVKYLKSLKVEVEKLGIQNSDL